MLVKTINKSLVYRKHKTEFKMESYLNQVTNTSHRTALTKLRLSDHRLKIESGRHIRPKINRENRTCKLCSKPNKPAQLRTKSTSSPDVIISCT